MSYEKLIRDGKVAVIYSPGFGAGWSTWNPDHAAALIFDKAIAEAIISGNNDTAERIAETKYPGIYTGGASDLRVQWLDVGAVFEIEEYDGSESIHVIGDRRYFTA